MKSAAILALYFGAVSADEVPGPIGKVLTMISDLESKILAQGATTQKEYEEYAEFCEDRNKELSFEVKTGKANVDDLTTTIAKCSADAEELTAKIADLAASLAKDNKMLQKATALRKKEAAAFAKNEKDLVDTVDTLVRAGGIIEKEMAKGSSFAQMSGIQGLMTALDTLVKAQEIGSADGSKLSALLQSYSADKDQDQDEDDSTGAPDAATYESKSGGILDALADLQSKAEDELSEARKAESKSQNNFDLKKQALTDEIKFANKDMDEAKKTKAATEEKKAGAEGELTSVTKALNEDKKANSLLHADCMSRASDFEAETASRGEELKALATAKKIIKEATAFSQVSFMQVKSELAGMDAVRIVRSLAQTQRSKSLARLASRMETEARRGGANPFAKVTGMINDMIAKLEEEAESEAGQKAFCDKSLGEANAKKDEAQTAIDKLNVKLEQGNARSTKLKEEVTVLQSELAKLMASQQEMDRLRASEKATFESESAELKKGLTGIQTALKVLRDYYAAEGGSADGNAGAGGGIISLLEVCESDISKELAEITATEEDAAAQYKSETQENELVKMTKDKDVEFKQKEIAGLEKSGTEHTTDKNAVQTELDAVMESLASLEKQCLGKAESYAEKVAKQKAEIDGLKSALTSLGGASLMQTGRRARRGTLRGVLKA